MKKALIVRLKESALHHSIDKLTIVSIIVLVGLGSFAIGKLSVEPCMLDSVEAREAPSQNEVVASVAGEKYHYPWCSGAVRIKQENRIVFQSTLEAREAGYTPAQNCKGLE
jgi:hypothetical protein